MMETTSHVKLITRRKGQYEKLVFQQDDGTYLMCTKLPNWNNISIEIGDSGFLTIEDVEAGERYFDRSSDCYRIYYYSNTYLKDFIKDKTNKIIL